MPDTPFDRFTAALVADVRLRTQPDLSLRQLTTLLVVEAAEAPPSVREIADRLGIPKPSVTRALDRLHLLKLATRRKSKDDRRLIEAALLPKGRAYVAGLKSRLNGESR